MTGVDRGMSGAARAAKGQSRQIQRGNGRMGRMWGKDRGRWQWLGVRHAAGPLQAEAAQAGLFLVSDPLGLCLEAEMQKRSHPRNFHHILHQRRTRCSARGCERSSQTSWSGVGRARMCQRRCEDAEGGSWCTDDILSICVDHLHGHQCTAINY